MRKSHEHVVKAFVIRRPAHQGNLSTNGQVLNLFGNPIAKWTSEDHLLIMPVYPQYGLSSTTVAAIRALCQISGSSYTVGNDKFIPYLYNHKLGTKLAMQASKWYRIVGPDHGKEVK